MKDAKLNELIRKIAINLSLPTMTKSDRTLDEIDLEKAYKQQTKPDWIQGKMVNAFDTETNDGTVFMLSFAIDEFTGVIGNQDVSELSRLKIWEKLTHNACRTSHAINVWYNLNFDANAILSDILKPDELKELAITNETTTEVEGMEYEIKYVKSKFMFIKDKHGNRYEHFDISQFFYTTLDNAANEWLGDTKKNDNIETGLFGSNNPQRLEEIVSESDAVTWESIDKKPGDEWTSENATNYIRSNYGEIAEYAEKDAILTKELAIELIYEAEGMNIPMGKPFSTGYLSAEYLRANMGSKPKFGSKQYQKFFWDAYYGGRFEVFKRGNVGEVVAPDINSAYPAVMANLPDPSTLFWQYHSNTSDEYGFNDGLTFDVEDLESADYGVVKAEVTTRADNGIQPFAHKIDGKVHYPIMTNQELTVILPIFLFALQNDLLASYTLKEAWLAETEDTTEYPFSFINDLYGQRKLYEKNGYMRKGKLLKIILNSLYGKTCQSTGYKRIIEIDQNEIYELDANEQIFPIDFMAVEPIDIIKDETLEDYEKLYPEKRISKNIREIIADNEYIVESFHAGRRFNPFIASYITGLTRLELHKQVVNHNLVNNTVMFATDCIMVEKDAYEDSNFSDLIQTPDESLEGEAFKEQAIESLGSWDFDYEGYGFVVGSGVYEVEKPDGELYTKTRGFLEKSFPKGLREMAKEHPKGIPIKNVRPLTISEVLIKPDRGSVSEFIENEKTLLPNFDDKRHWHNPKADFHYLLSNIDESDPISLMDEQKALLKEVQEAKGKVQNE